MCVDLAVEYRLSDLRPLVAEVLRLVACVAWNVPQAVLPEPTNSQRCFLSGRSSAG